MQKNFGNLNDQELRSRAKELASFYIHLFWYIVVNFGLNLFDYFSDGKFNWAFYATFGWGIGIISHGISTFFSFDIEDKIYNRLKK
jgi:hypothetical protein